MSEWLDASSSSNKLKQSYFQNFIDVSGTVSLRNNHNLNLYNNESTPEFSINSQEIRVRDSNVYYDISHTKLQYIKDLTENVHDRLEDLIAKTRNISADTTNITSTITFDGSVELRDRIIALSDLSLNGNINTNGNSEFTGTVGLNGDISINGILDVTGDTTMNDTLTVNKATALNSSLFVNGKSILTDDVSMNADVDINGDLKITGNLSVFQNKTIETINTVVNDYTVIITEDISLNGELKVSGDASLNGELYVKNATTLGSTLAVTGATTLKDTLTVSKASVLSSTLNVSKDVTLGDQLIVSGDVSMNKSLFVDENIGIGIHNPIVSLDVSSNNAIRIPRGTTDERPTTSGEATEGGYIRYNMTNHQFEGYGPGNSWGSLGGVINVAQNTKIITSTPNADSTNNELIFFTATAGSTVEGDAIERMVINSTGDISMNHRLLVAGDVSMNSNLNIRGDVSLNSELYVKNATNLNSTLNVSKASTLSSTLVVTGKTTLSSDVSMNANVDICGNFYAQYPIASIPPTAIQGVGSEEGKVMVSVYTSDEIQFDDDEFVIVKEDKDKIQITPYGIFVTDNIIYGDDDFTLFKEDPMPKVEQNLRLLQNLSVSGDAVFGNTVTIPTLPIITNTDDAASCAYVKNQNYILSSTLMKQF